MLFCAAFLTSWLLSPTKVMTTIATIEIITTAAIRVARDLPGLPFSIMLPAHAIVEARCIRTRVEEEAHAPSSLCQPICWFCAPLSGRAGPITGSSPSGSLRNTVNSPLPSIDGPDVQRPSGNVPSTEVA